MSTTENQAASTKKTSNDDVTREQLFHHIELENDLPTTVQSLMISPSTYSNIERRTKLIIRHMGSMAQCRGDNGDVLRDAGVIPALIDWTSRLLENDEFIDSGSIIASNDYSKDMILSDDQRRRQTLQTIASLIAALGALRDLSCGNALNRRTLWQIPSGITIIISVVSLYKNCSWDDVAALSRVRGEEKTNDLRLLTNALGAIRNVTHSCSNECGMSFHEEGGTMELIDRLLNRCGNDEETKNEANGNTTDRRGGATLPPASLPWREACYRAAGALINVCEKNTTIAAFVADFHPQTPLVNLLIESWGGNDIINGSKAVPLLHLGLANILRYLERRGSLEDDLKAILIREDRRKELARKREEDRKRRKELARMMKNKEN